MDELHEAAELMVLAACIAAEARAEQEQEGPDALATAVENMRATVLTRVTLEVRF